MKRDLLKPNLSTIQHQDKGIQRKRCRGDYKNPTATYSKKTVAELQSSSRRSGSTTTTTKIMGKKILPGSRIWGDSGPHTSAAHPTYPWLFILASLYLVPTPHPSATEDIVGERVRGWRRAPCPWLGVESQQWRFVVMKEATSVVVVVVEVP